MVRCFSALDNVRPSVLLPYFGSEMEARCVWLIIDRPRVAHRVRRPGTKVTISWQAPAVGAWKLYTCERG